jgi:hypothetical protein
MKIKSALPLIFCILLSGFIHSAQAREITVKYRDTPVDTSSDYEEYDLIDSSFVKEIIYNNKHQYALVRLKNTFYHYCNIPNNIVSNWVNSNSLGKYYHSHVKGSFSCQYEAAPN